VIKISILNPNLNKKLSKKILFPNFLEEPLIPSSSKNLNKLITPKGKKERAVSRGITLVWGSNGAGKTSFCLNMAFNANKIGLKVLYIDHEGGIDTNRLELISKEFKIDPRKIITKNNGKDLQIENITIKFIPYLDEMKEYLLSNLYKMYKSNDYPKLLIIDNIASHYIALANQDIKDSAYGRETKKLVVLSSQIKEWAFDWGMAVIFVTYPISELGRGQVLLETYGRKIDFKNLQQGITPDITDRALWVGGVRLGFDAKIHLQFSKLGLNKRKVTLFKHRSKPLGESTEIKITDYGIGD